MSSLVSTQNSNIRFVLVGALIALLVASFPLAAVASGYSGDDAYDPASSSFDAAGAGEIADLDNLALAFSGGYSGDDAYDPAAGGLDSSFFFAEGSDECDDPSGFALIGTFSGDDAYDPAAGGIPSSSFMALACALPGIAIQ